MVHNGVSLTTCLSPKQHEEVSVRIHCRLWQSFISRQTNSPETWPRCHMIDDKHPSSSDRQRSLSLISFVFIRGPDKQELNGMLQLVKPVGMWDIFHHWLGCRNTFCSAAPVNMKPNCSSIKRRRPRSPAESDGPSMEMDDNWPPTLYVSPFCFLCVFSASQFSVSHATTSACFTLCLSTNITTDPYLHWEPVWSPALLFVFLWACSIPAVLSPRQRGNYFLSPRNSTEISGSRHRHTH